MSDQKQELPPLAYKAVPWDPSWRTSTPGELQALRAALVALSEPNTILTSTRLTAGTISHLTLLSGHLSYVVTGFMGTAKTTGAVTENVISTWTYDKIVRRKVWQRYFTFDHGMVWKCTYNENPSSPKHMMSQGIPMITSQLIEELTNMSRNRRAAAGDELRIKSEALENCLCTVDWKDELTTSDIHDLANVFAKMQHLFSHRFHITDELAKDVLDVLQQVAAHPSPETRPSLYEAYKDFHDTYKKSPTPHKLELEP